MTKRRGAPRLIEREDPLSFVLRNRPAREVLERLKGQPLMIPIQIRKAIDIHPEAFRRLVSDLDDFDLISTRVLPRRRSRHAAGALALRQPIGMSLTPRGQNVLEVAQGVRRLVRRQAHLLPKSTVAHWLPAPSRPPASRGGVPLRREA
jgi:hypothetical protein